MKKLILLLIMIVLFSAVGTQAAIETTVYRITHDDNERIVNLYVPDGDIEAVLIALHPIYSSGLAMEVMTGLNDIADERGWVIAYANSLKPYWDDGRVEAGLPPELGMADDVGFINALAEFLKQDYQVDTAFLVGMGNGGSMAMRVACEQPEQFDSVIVASVLMMDYQMTDCKAQDEHSPINMLFLYGNQDFIFLEDGRNLQTLSGATWNIHSAEETLDYWLEHNNCDPESQTEIGATTIFNDCKNDTVTAFYTMQAAGNWPRMADNDLNRLGIDATEILAAFLDGDDNWTDLAVSEASPDVIARNYILYIPQNYDPNTPTPVVVALHGRGASMVSQARSSGFNDVADEHGFIVLYPQAYDPNLQDPVWNYLLDTTILTPMDWNDDEFLDTLVDDLAKDLNIDMSRLYVTGLSNGGYMVNRLACTRSDRYAAFAPVSGAAPFGLVQLCDGASHSPYMLVQGTADTISPWIGIVQPHPITGQSVYMIAPVVTTMEFWAAHNECGTEVITEDLESTDPDSSVTIMSVNDCPNDAAVVLYAVLDGGHNWPGVFDFESKLLGEVNMDYNASEKIWEFFSQFTLEGKVEE